VRVPMRLLLASAAGLALATSLTVAAAPVGAANLTPQTRAGATAIVAGTGHAVARSVTVRSSARITGAADSAGLPGPLGQDGLPAGSNLPASASSSGRTRPASAPQARAGTAAGPNAGQPARAAESGMRSAMTAVSSPQVGFRGISEGSSDCTNCQTPDVSAAVSSTQIAETVNLSLQVYSKSGTTLCTEGLSDLLGAYTALSRPRIQYDNANKRFSLIIDSVPQSSSDVPIQYLATSQADDACGAWWVYSMVFTGSSFYPFGATLDYPYLGQDSTSILSSTNNYDFGGTYIGSAAYAMPKSAAYSGTGFDFTTYSVAFSTAPVTVAGIPTFTTTSTYWLASVPGTGYDLYVMPTNPAGTISLQAVIKATFSAPSRQVNQPGTSQTLDPLDGRIESAPVQDGNYVWFTHGVDDSGYPTVRYGAIDVKTDQAITADAFHGNGSDDFNPSIGVTDAGSNTNYIWVNWAYTDKSAGVPVSDTVVGIAPGQGVPNEIGADLTLVTGSSTSSISTFGGYSSTEVDPAALNSSCPAGLTALTSQEYFTSTGSWTTQLARTTFC
jgi:hypothetical protein